MKHLLALLLFCTALPLWAVKIGDSIDSVVAEKGRPANRLERGSNAVFTYPDAVIRFTDGKVTAIEEATRDYATGTAPATSAPARRPAAPARTHSEGWTTNYAVAVAQAAAENKKVFLFFTGSDWCGWCMKLDREILSTPEFREFAQGKLILVKLDFPQQTALPDDLRQQNQELAQKYGIRGFPTVVILSPSGQPVGRLGYQRGGPGPFIAKVDSL